jgi:hypothetical protein
VADPNTPDAPWSWVPPEWMVPPDQVRPHAPEMAPSDEWNDGAGPAANAEIAAAELAKIRAQMQGTADKTLGPIGGLAFGDGMAQEQLDALNGPSPERDLKQLERVRANMRTAGSALGRDGAMAFSDGMSQELMNSIAGAPKGRAYIAQAVGPVGTIGQIGEELPFGAIDTPLSQQDAQQIEIDPQLATPPDLDFEGDFVGAGSESAADPGGALGAEWATESIEEQEKHRADVEGAREAFHRAGQINASTQALKDAEDNARAYQTAVRASQQKAQALDVEAQALANEKIDPLRDVSTGQKIAGVLAAFIGGFGMSKTGRNIGMEAVDSMINNAIEVQKANLSTRKDMLGRRQNAIGEQLAMGKDLYHAQETVRLATYDQVIKKLETEAQQFDPRGTRALKAMDAANQMKAKRMASLEKYQADEAKRIEAREKRDLEIAKHNLEVHKANAEIALKNAQTKKLGSAGIAKVKPVKFDDVLRTGAQLRQLGIQIEDSQVPAEGLSVGQAESVAKAGKAVEDKNKAGRENSPEELTREKTIGAPPKMTFDEAGEAVVDYGTGNLKQADNTDWIIPTTDEGKVFRKKKASADGLIGILDEIRAIRERVGGESSWGNSPEYGRLQVLKERGVVIAKGGVEGMSSDADMERLLMSMGIDSPASFRSQAAKLDEGRRGIEEQLNNDARSLKYTGKRIAYPDPVKASKVARTPEQETVQRVLAFDPKHMKPDELREIGKKALDPREGPQLPASHRKAIDDLVTVFNSPNSSKKERETAGAHLEDLKNKASSGVVRDYATKAATAGAAASVPVSTD